MKTVAPGALLRAASKAARSAHCPYSGYAVGAALLTDDGRVTAGCNVENSSYGLTICAERAAVFGAVAAGRTRFRALAVVARGKEFPYPCGACRQVLAEFCGPDLPVYAATATDLAAFETLRLGDLLPKAFRKTPPRRRAGR